MPQPTTPSPTQRQGAPRHAVITGASSGIGAAIAKQLAAARGWHLSLGARRVERLEGLAAGAFTGALDVTDEDSVEGFLQGARAAHGPIDALINNAGLARGVERVAAADGEAWREMVETNVMGLMHVTRRVIPEMESRRTGHVLMIGSIAGRQPYANGSVYCATKRAVQAISQSLRLETYDKGIRVTNIEPGMVETEFSVVRFKGDETKADAVYGGMQPLTAEDIANCAVFALNLPPHVNVDDMLVTPQAQGAATAVHRDPGPKAN